MHRRDYGEPIDNTDKRCIVSAMDERAPDIDAPAQSLSERGNGAFSSRCARLMEYEPGFAARRTELEEMLRIEREISEETRKHATARITKPG
jgi:hypothetical protein